MWGQAFSRQVNNEKYGIIPTRVGTRKKSLEDAGKDRDHPHACGDKLSTAFLITYFSGSSPRVWGQAVAFHRNGLALGIIPTRVGTSTETRCVTGVLEDHPHACGDKPPIYSLCKCYIGSSPRVWGQACILVIIALCPRIIPTRVGTRHLRR